MHVKLAELQEQLQRTKEQLTRASSALSFQRGRADTLEKKNKQLQQPVEPPKPPRKPKKVKKLGANNLTK